MKCVTLLLLAVLSVGCAEQPKGKTKTKKVVIVKKDTSAVDRAVVKALRNVH